MVTICHAELTDCRFLCVGMDIVFTRAKKYNIRV